LGQGTLSIFISRNFGVCKERTIFAYWRNLGWNGKYRFI